MPGQKLRPEQKLAPGLINSMIENITIIILSKIDKNGCKQINID